MVLEIVVLKLLTLNPQLLKLLKLKPLILKLIKIVKIWNVIINSETTDIKVTNVDTDMTETIAKTFVEHSLLLLINILSNM